MRTLVNHVVDRLFIARNPRAGHSCTSHCGEVVQVVIGHVEGKSFKCAITPELTDVIEDFETLTDCCLGFENGTVKIESFGLQFVPCPRNLEIIEAAIHLENMIE